MPKLVAFVIAFCIFVVSNVILQSLLGVNVSTQNEAAVNTEQLQKINQSSNLTAQQKKEVDPSALAFDDFKDSKKLRSLFNAERTKEVNTKKIDFVNAVQKQEKCDGVASSDVSLESQSDNAIFYADCYNGERFYMTEKDNMPVHSSERVAINTSDAMLECKNAAIQETTKNNLKIDFDTLGFTENKSVTGAVTQSFNFSIENVNGEKPKYKIECSWAFGKPMNFSITQRP